MKKKVSGEGGAQKWMRETYRFSVDKKKLLLMHKFAMQLGGKVKNILGNISVYMRYAHLLFAIPGLTCFFLTRFWYNHGRTSIHVNLRGEGNVNFSSSKKVT